MSTVSGGDGAAADPLPLASEARAQPAGDKIGVVSSNTAVPALPAPAVHLVDDEAAVVRDALSFLLRSHGLTVVAYASAPELLAGLGRAAAARLPAAGRADGADVGAAVACRADRLRQ